MGRRGEGSVYFSSALGKWQASHSFVVNGKRVRIAGTGSSAKEAIDRRAANYRKYLSRELVPTPEVPLNAPQSAPINLTTAEYLLDWLARIDRERVQPTTLRGYRTRIEKHLIPHIGTIPLVRLLPDDVEHLFLSTLPSIVGADGSPLLGASVRLNIWKVLDAALTKAVTRNLLLRNPMKGLAPPKPTVKDEGLEKYLWLPEFLLTKLEDEPLEVRVRWLTAILLGLRQSERLGLTWGGSFTHLAGSKPLKLTVRQQIARHESGSALGSGLYLKQQTKSKRHRSLIVPPYLAALFRQLKEEQDQLRDAPTWKPLPGLDDLVFMTKTGKPIRQQNDSREWHQLLAKYSTDPRKPVPDLRGHAARHLQISLLLKLGQPIEMIRDIAGHGSEIVTREVYKHTQAQATAVPLAVLESEMRKRVND